MTRMRPTAYLTLLVPLLIRVSTAQAETAVLQLQPDAAQVILWRTEGDRERGLALEAAGQYKRVFDYVNCMVFRAEVQKGMRAHVLWRRAGLVRVLLLDRRHAGCEGIVDAAELRTP